MMLHLSTNTRSKALHVCLAWMLLASIALGQEERILKKTAGTTTSVVTTGGTTTTGGKKPGKKQRGATPAPVPIPVPPPPAPVPLPPPPTPPPTAPPVAPPPAPKNNDAAVGGLQPDCFQFDPNKFNACLELNTMDMATAYATPGLCIQRCTATTPSAICPLARLKVVPGFVNNNWMPNALEAKKKLEKLITKDTINPFAPLAEIPTLSLTTITSTSFLVDDILIRVSEGPPPFTPTAIMSTSVQKTLVSPTNGISYSAICNIVLFGGVCGKNPNYFPYIGTPGFTDIFFHEYLHCLGLGPLNPAAKQYFVTDALGRSIWTGPAAVAAWRDLGCTGDIPMDSSTGYHLEGKCFVNEIMQPSTFPGQNALFSDITAGMMSDIGYTVDYKATDKFKRSNLNACACGDFCPKAFSEAKCTRRLNNPQHLSSRRKRTSSRRKLDPITDSATAAPVPPALTEEQSAYMDYVRSLFCPFPDDPSQDSSCEVHFLAPAQDGSGAIVDMHYTMAEVTALIVAQITPSIVV